MTSSERGSPSTPESAVWMWSTGMASTTSTAPAATIDTTGRFSTRSSNHDQARGSPVRLSGLRNGTRPLLTRSPSLDRTAGSTVSEADEKHDGPDRLAHRPDLADGADQADRRGHRRDGQQQGDQGGQQCSKGENEDHQRDRQRGDLGLLEVLRERL